MDHCPPSTLTSEKLPAGQGFHAASCCPLLDIILCADNCEALAAMHPESVDLVVTSPPYDDLRNYGGHSWDFERLAGELTRVLKPGGVIVWVVADATINGSETLTSMRQAIHFKDVCGLNVHDTMIYHKRGQHMERFGHRKYPGAWEYVFVLTKGQPKAWNPIRDIATIHAGDRNSSTVRQPDGSLKRSHSNGRPCKEYAIRDNHWSYAVGSGHTDPDMPNDHPAAFPLRMASDHVTSWSNPGDVVLDPFAGSGTTLKAAKELNRRFIGIEINPEYVEICKRRIAQDVLPLFSDN
jgi:DNA modification methylase